MFIGHYAVALAAKPAAPKAPLWILLFAVMWADLLWPILLLLGVESVRLDPGNTAVTPLDFVRYPVSHSLVMDLAWAALLGGLVWWRLRDHRAAWVAGAAVVSHWVLDWVTHAPDMPLWFGGPRVGLGLWNSMAATVATEALMLAVAVALYLKATRAADRTGIWAFWGLNAFMVMVYLSNIFGPPPPSAAAIPWVTLALWLLLPWAAWIERHRPLRVTGE